MISCIIIGIAKLNQAMYFWLLNIKPNKQLPTQLSACLPFQEWIYEGQVWGVTKQDETIFDNLESFNHLRR